MKKALSEMKLSFSSSSVNEGFARVAVSAFVSRLDPTIEELTDLKTAVSEAVTNCCVHAYPDRLGPVYISAAVFEGGRVRVKVRDVGVGIPDVEAARRPLFTTGGDERSGLGFSVMDTFCDQVRVRSRPGRGTCVTLIKQFGERNG